MRKNEHEEDLDESDKMIFREEESFERFNEELQQITGELPKGHVYIWGIQVAH